MPNAILGIPQCQTLRVRCKIKRRTSVAPIDNDNTHIFIDAKLVRSLGVQLEPLQNL
jgi:hypothetical protein